MIPGAQDLTIQQGDDFTFVFRIRNKVWDPSANGGAGGYVAGDYVDLSGYVGAAQIRAKASDPTTLGDFTVTLADQTNPTTVGTVIVTMDHTLTAALPTTGGVWDVQLTDTGGLISTYLTGKVTVLAEVTRAS